MIETLPMASSNAKNMINHEEADANNSSLGYPMPSYVAAWKTYRTLSNEDDVISKRVSQTLNRNGRASKLLDIGPGDGRVILRTLIRLRRKPSLLGLIEPNQQFLDDTAKAISFDRFFGHCDYIKKKLIDCNCEDLLKYDTILCTHTLYFLSDDELERLLELVQAGAQLIIVIDHPDSIFTTLWKRTAPDFCRRVISHCEKIQNLDRCEFAVAQGEIEAEISNPFDLREEVRDLVVSMLSYSDVEDMLHEELRSVENTIRNALVGSTIPCKSYFFEISRK